MILIKNISSIIRNKTVSSNIIKSFQQFSDIPSLSNEENVRELPFDENELLSQMAHLSSEITDMKSIITCNKQLTNGKKWEYNFQSSYWKDGEEGSLAEFEAGQERGRQNMKLLRRELEDIDNVMHPTYSIQEHPPLRTYKEFKREVDEFGQVRGVGRRKTAKATIQLWMGTGQVSVNGKRLVDYFKDPMHRQHAIQALDVTRTNGQFDMRVLVRGGGVSGQAQVSFQCSFSFSLFLSSCPLNVC